MPAPLIELALKPDFVAVPMDHWNDMVRQAMDQIGKICLQVETQELQSKPFAQIPSHLIARMRSSLDAMPFTTHGQTTIGKAGVPLGGATVVTLGSPLDDALCKMINESAGESWLTSELEEELIVFLCDTTRVERKMRAIQVAQVCTRTRGTPPQAFSARITSNYKASANRWTMDFAFQDDLP